MDKINVTIDPGTAGAGFAIWDATPEVWSSLCSPLEVGVLHQQEDWLQSAKGMYGILGGILDMYKDLYKVEVDKVFCEYPAYFDSAKGNMSAGEGSLVKLSVSVGTFAALCWSFNAEFIPVRVIDWKGQLPKDAVIHRIKTKLPDMKADSHAWDAIGVGLYVKGHFEATSTKKEEAKQAKKDYTLP